jgi:hypothetical protein
MLEILLVEQLRPFTIRKHQQKKINLDLVQRKKAAVLPKAAAAALPIFRGMR